MVISTFIHVDNNLVTKISSSVPPGVNITLTGKEIYPSTDIFFESIDALKEFSNSLRALIREFDESNE